MAKVKFLATTLTSKGRFAKGDVSNLFTDKEAKDLQRLSSVESPIPSPVKKEKKKKAKVEKPIAEKVVEDESEESTEK